MSQWQPTLVAMLLQQAIRTAWQVRTLPERVMETLLVFVPLDLFERGLQQFGASAKDIALVGAYLGMAVLLVVVGFFAVRTVNGWLVLLVGFGLWLVAMVGSCPHRRGTVREWTAHRPDADRRRLPERLRRTCRGPGDRHRAPDLARPGQIQAPNAPSAWNAAACSPDLVERWSRSPRSGLPARRRAGGSAVQSSLPLAVAPTRPPAPTPLPTATVAPVATGAPPAAEAGAATPTIAVVAAPTPTAATRPASRPHPRCGRWRAIRQAP